MTSKFTFLKIDIIEHSKLVAVGPPYDVWPMLDRFLDFVQRTTKKYGGKVWSWQGDGGLCAFPAGRRFENANKGVEAALEILRAISPFWISDDEPEPFPEAKTKFKIRIAAHLGDADIQKDIGRVHSSDINLVAHLERVAAPNSIVVTEKVLNCCNKKIQRLFTVATPDKFEGESIKTCELYGPKHLQTWDKVLRGIGILVRAIQDEKFKPDLVIGCTRSGGIVGAVLAGHLGQERFVVLNRRDKGSKGRREIVFDDVVILNNNANVLPRDSHILLCFYQIQTGETERAFYSYVSGEGFKNIFIAVLFLDSRGKEELMKAGLKYVSAYDSVPNWGDTPWKLNDAWKLV